MQNSGESQKAEYKDKASTAFEAFKLEYEAEQNFDEVGDGRMGRVWCIKVISTSKSKIHTLYSATCIYSATCMNAFLFTILYYYMFLPV